jgi:hypothetical protein
MTGAVTRQCNSYPNRTYDEQHRIARCHPQKQIAVHAPRPVAPYNVMRTGAGLSVVNVPYQVWLHSQHAVIFRDTRADVLAIGVSNPCRLRTGPAAAGQMRENPSFRPKLCPRT